MERIDEPSEGASEATPLLAENGHSTATLSPQDDPASAGGQRGHGASSEFPAKTVAVIVLAITMIAFFEAATILQSIPLNQVLEDIICRDVVLTGQPPTNCGENTEVQAELAHLRGWQTTLELLPGILTAVPYGYVADNYGRKFVLVLSVVGMILEEVFYASVCWWSNIFPVRLTWLASAGSLIGGGPVVLNGIFFSMLSDLTPEAYRSSVFFYFGAVVIGSEVVFSSVASTLMQKNVWTPIAMGLSLLAPVLLISLLIPETLPRGSEGASRPVPTSEDDNSPAGYPSSQQPKTVWIALRDAIHRLSAGVAFLFGPNRHVTLLLATLLVTSLGKQAQEVLLQFARKRYDWTWAQAGYLVTLKAFITLLVLLLLLPGATYALGRWTRWPARRRDLWLARASCAAILVGTAIIGLSFSAAMMLAGIVVYCLGNGYNLGLRSLLAALVEPDHRSTLFSAVGILESLGAVIAGPLLAETFRLGLAIDFVGLPFLVAAALFAIAMAVLVTVRLPTAP